MTCCLAKLRTSEVDTVNRTFKYVYKAFDNFIMGFVTLDLARTVNVLNILFQKLIVH